MLSLIMIITVQMFYANYRDLYCGSLRSKFIVVNDECACRCNFSVSFENILLIYLNKFP